MEWMVLPFKKYFEFTGRSRRKEYWMFMLLLFIVNGILKVVEAVLGIGGPNNIGILSAIFVVATIIPGLSVMVRRLHDTNRSGWWGLILLLPLVGAIVILVMMLSNGTAGDNKYGPNPKSVPV